MKLHKLNLENYYRNVIDSAIATAGNLPSSIFAARPTYNEMLIKFTEGETPVVLLPKWTTFTVDLSKGKPSWAPVSMTGTLTVELTPFVVGMEASGDTTALDDVDVYGSTTPSIGVQFPLTDGKFNIEYSVNITDGNGNTVVAFTNGKAMKLTMEKVSDNGPENTINTAGNADSYVGSNVTQTDTRALALGNGNQADTRINESYPPVNANGNTYTSILLGNHNSVDCRDGWGISLLSSNQCKTAIVIGNESKAYANGIVVGGKGVLEYEVEIPSGTSQVPSNTLIANPFGGDIEANADFKFYDAEGNEVAPGESDRIIKQTNMGYSDTFIYKSGEWGVIRNEKVNGRIKPVWHVGVSILRGESFWYYHIGDPIKIVIKGGNASNLSQGHSIAAENSIAIGNDACAGAYYADVEGTITLQKTFNANAIAIGGGAVAKTTNAIQIGTGVNETANTVQFNSYQILDANGQIPNERLAALVARIEALEAQVTPAATE